jgi:mitotic-spindle organizing protein 1
LSLRACAAAVLLEISTLLETGLDQETLAILLALCEQGVNPEALAAVVKELRREGAALRAAAEGAQDSSADPPVLA